MYRNDKRPEMELEGETGTFIWTSFCGVAHFGPLRFILPETGFLVLVYVGFLVVFLDLVWAYWCARKEEEKEGGDDRPEC